jgi:hypothetical protein
MRRLPEARRRAPAKGQVQRLARWLREWDVDRRLADEGAQIEAATVAGPEAGAMELADPGGEPLAEGQIRLLFPDTPETRDRPVFVAVLQEQQSAFLVAPFGRFSEPALEGEWLTGRDAPGLRVLCVWNCFAWPPVRLLRSWLVDELSPTERAGSAAVLQFVRRGIGLPPGAKRHCGPPLRHPADPRQEYRSQERFFANELRRTAGAAGSAGAETKLWPEPDASVLKKAAETKTPYGRAPSRRPASK